MRFIEEMEHVPLVYSSAEGGLLCHSINNGGSVGTRSTKNFHLFGKTERPDFICI